MLLSSIFFLPNLPSYGHLYGYNVQEWKNQRDNILIQFDTNPKTPIVGKNSIMNFSVQNLQTGKHLNDFTETVTVVYQGTGSSSYTITHKFDSKPVKDGDFSQNYTFPSGGTYGIFLRIDTLNIINVSRFTVFVSSPQFQITNMIYLLLPFIIMIGIFAAIGIIMARHIYRKR